MKSTILSATALLALSSCAAVPPANERVELRFAAMFGDAAFRCGQSYDGIGTTASRVTPTDLRFFVTDVALIDAQGRETRLALEQDGKWQHRDVAMLDFENGSGPCTGGTPELRDRVVGTVPAGTYTGARFTLGVPFDLNHGDTTTAPSPLNLTAMFWSWQAGYKFLKLDMTTRGLGGAPMASGHAAPAQPHRASGHGHAAAPAPSGHGGGHAAAPAPSGHGGGHAAAAAPSGHGGGHAAAPAASAPGGGHGGSKHAATGYALHLGSTQCAGGGPTAKPTACVNPNRVEVTLAGFDVRRDVVVADLRAVLAASNVDVNAPNTSPGCMSFLNDADCMGVMQRLGVAYGGVASTGQMLFSARPAARVAAVP